MTRIVNYVVFCCLLFDGVLNCVAGPPASSDIAARLRCHDLCAVVGDTSSKTSVRRVALSEIVERCFVSGMTASELSTILARFSFLKAEDYEFVRAFAGAWPFDESLSLNGNTLVAFRVHWNEGEPSSVVFLLISGQQPNDHLTPLFTGKWPAATKSVLHAAALVSH